MIAVIIPVYNEVKTVRSIVQIVLTWGRAEQIIVVDDGSTDGSAAGLSQFKKEIVLLRHAKNRGKSAAMVTGIRQSTADILLFADADALGLTHRDLDRIVDPLIAGRADMVLGIIRFWSLVLPGKRIEPYNDITGFRCIKRDSILSQLEQMEHLGYGIELFMNHLYSTGRILRVRLNYVYQMSKLEKQHIPDALISYVKEARDLVTQLIKNQADNLPPAAKSIATRIQDYLRQAGDIFS